jgi:hypothetical protein
LGDDAQKLDIVVTKLDVGGDNGLRGLSTAGNEGNDPFLIVFSVKRGAPLNPRRSARPVPPLKVTLASSLWTVVLLADVLTLGAVTAGIEISEIIIERDAAEASE